MIPMDVTFEVGGKRHRGRRREVANQASLTPNQALLTSPWPWAWTGGALLAAYLVLLPFVLNVTQLRQSSQVIALVLAVLGVNIATGYGGMISLGHGVFVAIGAFATAYYVDNLSLPWLLSLVAGAITAGLFGALVGLPALRIRGIHLALVTLCLAIAFQPIAKRFPTFTGGVSGRSVNATFNAPGWWPGDGNSANATYRYLFCVVVVALVIWVTRNFINSRPGRSIRALRDDDTAATVYGINVMHTRVGTFAVSASVAGLSGSLGVLLVPFTSQSTFTPQESLVLYATAVIGGLGFVWGAVLGVVAREMLSWFGSLLARIDNWGVASEVFDLLGDETLVFGAGLIALTFVFPAGLAGLLTRRKRLN